VFFPLQLTVKLMEAEPEALAPDVVSALNSALNGRYAGSIVARACVRKGCVLLVLDVLQTSPGQGLMAGALESSNLEMLQVGSHVLGQSTFPGMQ
jgi:DNA-directed RNA polymerase subunit E'/Rpb7